MKSALKTILILLFMSIVGTAHGQPAYYTVTASELNVRSGPGSQYSKVIQFHKGDIIIVQQMYDDNWAEIKVASATCYVSRKYITYKEPVPQQQTVKEKKSKKKNENTVKFWVCFILALIFYFLSFKLSASSTTLSVIMNLLCAITLIVWANISSYCFWFLEFEEINIVLLIINMFLTAAFFGIAWGTAWNNIKRIKRISFEPWLSLICFCIGCLWGYIVIRYAGIFFDEHPIMSFFAIAGACTSNHIPTIYVPGEGYITGHGHDGGGYFTGDNGYEYWHDKNGWHPFN